MGGHWTATPPSVPGWYWWRENAGELPLRLEVWVNKYLVALTCNRGLLRRMGGEWWSELLQEPPT